MASTTVQHLVEDWVRRHWMEQEFGAPFYSERLPLKPGGVFEFDAVTPDHKTAACISTSGAKTSTGKNASAKMQKLRSDMLFLLMAKEPERRIVVLTEPDMYDQCMREKEAGRIPQEIEFASVDLPKELRAKLVEARKTCSDEMG